MYYFLSYKEQIMVAISVACNFIKILRMANLVGVTAVAFNFLMFAFIYNDTNCATVSRFFIMAFTHVTSCTLWLVMNRNQF